MSASASITDSKLDQLTTAGKVSGASLTLLGSIPSGGGIVPIANLATGTPDGTKFIRDDGTLQAPTVTASNALTGSIIQTVFADGFTATSGATNFPIDNTTPQITEGTQVMTATITPNSASNKILVNVVANVSSIVGNGSGVCMALFNTDFHATDSIVVVRSTDMETVSTAPSFNLHLQAYVTARTILASTFKVRIGFSTNTVYFNTFTGTNLFNGTFGSSIILQEVKV